MDDFFSSQEIFFKPEQTIASRFILSSAASSKRPGWKSKQKVDFT